MKYVDLKEVKRFSKLLYLQEHICLASKLQLSLTGRMLEETKAMQMSFFIEGEIIPHSVVLQSTWVIIFFALFG